MNEQLEGTALTAQRLGADTDASLGWLAIAAFVGGTALAITLGLGSILNSVFPAMALVLGLLLYFRFPTLYVGLTLWLWCLVPLVRRLSDFTSTYREPSPMLLAPYLVTCIALVTLFRRLPVATQRGGGPFMLVFGGLFYALMVGLAQGQGAVAIVKSLLAWLSPPVFAFYLYENWVLYPKFRKVLLTVVVWAVLLMGSYAIYQYMVAPEWDMYWLTNSGFTSAGRPEPMGFRVWGTLNSPGPFGNMMRACLLILFSASSPVLLPSVVVGYLSFLLSMIRSAWGGWLIGVLVLLSSLRAKHQMQVMGMLVIFGLVIFPLATIDDFSAVSDRFDTFTNLENDGSANIRRKYFGILIRPALTSLVGNGIGDRHYDWGIFTFLFNLGWIGTLFYVGGLLLLLVQLFRVRESQQDKLAASAKAVVVSTIVQLPLGSVMLYASGLMMWTMLGLGLAAGRYYRSELGQTDNRAAGVSSARRSRKDIRTTRTEARR